MNYIGLDVHKRVVEACAINDAGTILYRERFPMSREDLVAFAGRRLSPVDHVALEATTNTWAVARVLAPLVSKVVVSNPLKTKAIAEAKVKTDKVDAHVLAQLLRCDFLPSVWRPDEKTQQLRTLTSHRASLVAERTRLKNRIHAVLAERLVVPPVENLFAGKGLAWVRGLSLDQVGRILLDSHLRQLDFVENEIASLDKVLAERGYSDERVKLLMTLPGVQVAVAESILAALGDLGRFKDADHAASYLGLVPRTFQSADKCYHGPITKAGNSHARWMLIQAAQHLRNHPGPLGVFFRRIAKKKNHNVAVVATARKLVVIAWHMLTRNEPYRYAEPKSTEHKLVALRVAATGKRRKTGPKPGTALSPNYKTGVRTRTIKPLPQLYHEEALPSLTPPKAAEVRAVKQAGVTEYVEGLQRAHVTTKSPASES
jgi:transposase